MENKKYSEAVVELILGTLEATIHTSHPKVEIAIERYKPFKPLVTSSGKVERIMDVHREFVEACKCILNEE